MALTQIKSEGIKDSEVKNADMADDAVGIAELSATGTASNSTFLRGDNSWQAISTTTEGTAVLSTGETGTAKFLRVDGDDSCSWQVPPDTNTTYSVGDGGLTQNNFTNTLKTKLDGIATSANNYVHPNHSGEVTSTADGATVIADDTVDEANLKISNAGSNGQFLQKQSGNTGGLTWAAAAGGLTEADNWRLTADFSGGAQPMTSNFERVDGTLQASTQLGTGMSVSSGVWTFPSTGYWYVQFNHYFDRDGSTRYVDAHIDGTSDNGSNWDNRIAQSSSHITKDSGINWNVFGSQVVCTLLDITDTSNQKVRFGTSAGSAVTTHGGSSDSETQFFFLKLGDT